MHTAIAPRLVGIGAAAQYIDMSDSVRQDGPVDEVRRNGAGQVDQEEYHYAEDRNMIVLD